jgi:two-component system nitrate/nitrite response regulator NarL
MIAVLLVDDHTYIRKGIRYLLETVPDMEVVDIASNGIEAVAKARAQQPDVVVLDISMPLMNGMEATRQIAAACPRTRILALSLYDLPDYVQGALEAGADGYVLKDAIGEELVKAIRTLYMGKRYFSRKVAGSLDGCLPPWQGRRGAEKDS